MDSDIMFQKVATMLGTDNKVLVNKMIQVMREQEYYDNNKVFQKRIIMFAFHMTQKKTERLLRLVDYFAHVKDFIYKPQLNYMFKIVCDELDSRGVDF
jgi:hypothetical protein